MNGEFQRDSALIGLVMTIDQRPQTGSAVGPREVKALISICRADWRANPENTKVRLALLLFRVSNWTLHLAKPYRALASPFRAIYKLVVGWIIGIDIPADTSIGPGLRIMHGTGLVVHGKSSIGSGCTLRHGVTIGIKGAQGKLDGAPRLGNSVNVGSGAQILGPITVGDNATIGAGSIVLKNVPAGATAVGNPARLIAQSFNN
jgi:serine acetyltransferase